MKTFRCWQEVICLENLWGAWEDFERGKRRRPEVAAFALEADRHVLALRRQLLDGCWQPGGYRLLRITDPKRRLVAAAPVRDRVVHHALYRVLSPRIDRSFSQQSFACQPGRGSHRAVLRDLAESRRFRWRLQLDIRRYFYSVDRDILRGLLFRRLPEPAVRALLDRILDSGTHLYRHPHVAAWLGWEAPAPLGRGLPIGNLTSQWWGNLYLDGLDHFAQRTLRLPSWQRYMDDLTCFSDDRDELLAARDTIADWLRRERGLVLKDPAARPQRTSHRHLYLGYCVSPAGIALGPKARQRVPSKLLARVHDPRQLRASLSSLAGAWMFP